MGALGRPVEKPKNFKGTVLRLSRYLRPHALKLSLVFVFAIISTLFNIVGPKLLGQATTKIAQGLAAKYAAYTTHRPIPSLDFSYIGHIVLLLIGLYAVSSLLGCEQRSTIS
jgi:ATP-binding cassette subfamily B protein